MQIEIHFKMTFSFLDTTIMDPVDELKRPVKGWIKAVNLSCYRSEMMTPFPIQRSLLNAVCSNGRN
jgi:hypothetical protein